MTLFTIIAAAIVVMLLMQVVRGAPFVPSTRTTIATMVRLADIHPGMKVVDLGAGDGRVVIAFARAGAEAFGYEINPFLVWIARYRIKRAKLTHRAIIHLGSFWNKDLSKFEVITLFGMSHIMNELEEKLLRELQPGARVLSNAFRFPNWTHTIKEDSVYLYKK